MVCKDADWNTWIIAQEFSKENSLFWDGMFPQRNVDNVDNVDSELCRKLWETVKNADFVIKTRIIGNIFVALCQVDKPKKNPHATHR